MTIIQVTNDPKQQFSLTLPDLTQIVLTMRYVENQQGWYYSYTYGSVEVYNRRLVNSPNMLRQFRNIIPFGLACSTTDGYEPVFIDDFSIGRATLYLMDIVDVAQAETFIAGS